MTRSVRDGGGGLLIVSQFTLAADTRQGNRPSFIGAAPPAQGEALYDAFVTEARRLHPDEPLYTWWDYRGAMFQRNQGLRIDHILFGPAFRALRCEVDKTASESDHYPIEAVLTTSGVTDPN